MGEQFETIRAEELSSVTDDCPAGYREKIEQFSVRLARRLLQSACRRLE
jgi:hypothetical protein